MTRIRNSAPVDPNDRFAQQIKDLLRRVADLERGPARIVPWVAVSFTNSWSNTGSGFQVAQYRKIGSWVEVRGTVSPGSSGTSAFTLPSGFRPPANLRLAGAQGSGGNMANITVGSDGTFTIAYPGTGGVGFNIRFSVSS